ncbi:serine/threonine protein kinase [Sulfuracidifex metallicus]|uniref:serine/threonine protein kinase n=1 Tax=Sulfuracidifex metallicus TaxID=47303 RepID=UPI0022745C56|nr:serine/threonine protein kinase [Sulfuracidifex metallicus]MCY0849763.1 serine/threonine protein kinase [Sulfuracidifex metallicus]
MDEGKGKRGSGVFHEENSSLVEVKHFIYPKYCKSIEDELLNAGIKELLSEGKVKINDVMVIGKGKSGIVAMIDNERVVKIRRTDSPKPSMEQECSYQRNAFPVSPKVFSCGKNFIIMQRINGYMFPRKPSVEEVKLALIAARNLELLHVQHKEIARPWKNVMIDKDRAFIVDYDSATFKPSPNNVSKILSSFKETRELSIKYSKREIDFNKLLELINLYF